METPEIIIYTDGSSRGNPGPGGYGIIIEKNNSNYFKEFSQGFRLTTNNRMELLAVIEALKKIKKEKQQVHVYTDSKYVVDSVEKGWVFNWEKKNFKSKKNIDLWKSFLEIYRKHKVSFFWIKGHNNNLKNERCDKLAFNACSEKELKIDRGYEESKN
tara:strand:- start:19 stop:492 length:474 start_codon:yes stop_codon:yes gene_type:complete